MSTVAETIVERIVDAGIDTIFGMPGGESIFIMDAFREHGMRFVLVHNESSAVYMADAYARVTGQVGVVLTTLGPGAMNAVAGIGHAFLDRAPVLIITAKMWDAVLPAHTHQVLDQSAIISPMTKASFTLSSENVHDTMKHALRLTKIGCPGPVHIQVSKQMCEKEASSARLRLISSSYENKVEIVKANLAEVDQARQSLAAARKPIILSGLGLEPERPYAELKELAESLNAPVITTAKGKGALPADHPLAAGTLGLTRSDPVYELLAEADLVLAIGFDVVELVLPWDQTQAVNLIWMAPWANVDPVLPAIAELVGTMGPIMQQLSDSPNLDHPEWGGNRVAQFQQKQAAKLLPEPSPGRLRPQAVLQAVRAAVPRDTLVTTDVGSHKILTSLDWPAFTPNSFMLSNGLSCMGFGVPAAIGASLAQGKKPVVAVTGDGGFAMVSGELNLITELGVPVIIILMHDAALDLIRSAQNRSGKETYGTVFTNPDFQKIAEAYGILSRKVNTAEACQAAVAEAIEQNRPMIIEALIDPISYPTTPHTDASRQVY
ncbi:MAG: acetolactate synthase-1/2/3 large subunit [Cellvibrionaceae bacterium]|jgi:acetolactate synthase-1/2/3 large subunit